jgi:hypothetical protein
MKHIRSYRIFESWSDDYTYHFTDKGFSIDQSSNIIKGTYKGKFIQTELTDEFAEMIGRLSDKYYILRTKTYFNQTTGNASFEVEVSDKFKEVFEHILINLSGDKKIKFYVNRVLGISIMHQSSELSSPIMYVEGRLESGKERDIGILINDNKNGIRAIIGGYNSKKPKIDKENINKLFSIIDSGKIKNDTYVDRYEKFKKDVLELFN